MKNIMLLVVATILSLGFSNTAFCEDAASPLRAAIFIQNRAGNEFTDKIDVLNDMLTTRLTEKGFSVIDRNVVAAKFREVREIEPDIKQSIDKLVNTDDGANSSGGVENALAGASALRIAQMIGADYLIMASMTSFGQETRSFKGEGTHFGSNNKSRIYTLRIALKVLEGNSGGTVYGDTVSIAERVAVVDSLTIESTEVINKLLDTGALKIADNIGGKIQKIRDVKVKSAAVVEFSVKSNVDGADVELDGANIGSTPGRFVAAPGLHQLKISKQWLTPWDKTVNIFANQVLNVTLELSSEGIRRYSTLEKLKLDLANTKMRTEMEGKEREANIDINREQSEADAYSKKAIADGEKKKLEGSYDRIEGAPSTIIYK